MIVFGRSTQMRAAIQAANHIFKIEDVLKVFKNVEDILIPGMEEEMLGNALDIRAPVVPDDAMKIRAAVGQRIIGSGRGGGDARLHLTQLSAGVAVDQSVPVGVADVEPQLPQ